MMIVGRKVVVAEGEINGRQLIKDRPGHYHIERKECGDTINIYNITPGCWGWCIDNGMTKGTCHTLTEVAEKFII